jgi:hypothetical protein
VDFALTSRADHVLTEPYSTRLWSTDEELLAIRKVLDGSARDNYDKGFRLYLSGEWSAAKALLQKVLDHTKGKDGPSLHLMGIIDSKKYNGVAPSDWPGYSVEDDDH